MEHRLERRHPLTLDLELYYDRAFLGRFHTGNLSRSGLLIHGHGLRLPRFRLVDLILRTETDSCWVQAMVMHCSGQEAGLARLDTDPAYDRLLHAQLRARDIRFPDPAAERRAPSPQLRS